MKGDSGLGARGSGQKKLHRFLDAVCAPTFREESSALSCPRPEPRAPSP